MTGLAVWIFVACRHVFENLFDVTRETGHISMFAGKVKVGVFIVIELDPRKVCSHVTEAALFIDLSFGVNIAVTIATLVVWQIFILSAEMTLHAVDDLVFAV